MVNWNVSHSTISKNNLTVHDETYNFWRLTEYPPSITNNFFKNEIIKTSALSSYILVSLFCIPQLTNRITQTNNDREKWNTTNNLLNVTKATCYSPFLSQHIILNWTLEIGKHMAKLFSNKCLKSLFWVYIILIVRFPLKRT